MDDENSGFGDLRWNDETGEWYTIGKDVPLDAFGNPINPKDITIVDPGSSAWYKGITNLLKGTGPLGSAGQLIGGAGIAALLNKMFGGSGGGGFSGYQGGIPSYTATRTQTPFAEQRPVSYESVTPKPGEAAATVMRPVPYRPGQGGITYFTPMQYTLTPPASTPAPTPSPTPPPSGNTSGGNTSGGTTESDRQVAIGGGAAGGLAELIVQAARGSDVRGYNMGGYSGGGGRFLRGSGDGVSDSIPATIGQRQPARLADGEFVIDARTVSEIGNGSSEAGARKLYEMMDRVHSARKKAKRGKPSGADKYLPK